MVLLQFTIMYFDVTEVHSLEKFIDSFKMYKQINCVRCIDSL